MRDYPSKRHQRVRTIALDKDGNVWAGSTDGILIMNLKGGKFSITPLESPEEMKNGLASNDIVYLAKESNGTMWVGTNSGGLSRTTTKDDNGVWQFENFGVSEGLPSEEIRSFTFDKKGNVWIATDHMLCSFDIKKKIFTTFSNLDGVDETMCSEGAAVALPNGNILFGTLNGYYIVDRTKLTTKTGSLLKLRVTDFYLNEELQSPRLNDNFDVYIPESKSVEIPGNNDSFSFRFASMNYQFQHRVHYQYRLEGYEDEWRNADKYRIARYSNIPAGTYRFQVKAFLLESPENFDMRTIEVIVPPPFLLSTTAVWIYIIILAILAILLLWWYQERLRKKLQPATEASEENTEKVDKVQPQEEEATDEYEIINER